MTRTTSRNAGSTRREFITRSGALLGSALVGGGLLSACGGSARGGGSTGDGSFALQLGWLVTNGVIGEVAAIEKGFYKDAGIKVDITPGGPNNDGINAVASGSAQVGRYSSSPRIMLAASKGLPLRAIAAGVQKHPYAYFSLPENPVRSAKDLVGKTIGIQATARVLLDAVLAENDISQNEVNIKVIGSDMTPLKTGQVDVISGWVINVGQLAVLGEYETVLLWDLGIHLYAYPYYVTEDLLESSPEQLAGFLAATGKGWAWARDNLDEAIELLLKHEPGLDRAEQKAGAERLMDFMWDQNTAQRGWGTMSPETWNAQIKTWESLNQFDGGTPSVDDVMTMSVLEATNGKRPKLG